jgi:hypothetical protein
MRSQRETRQPGAGRATSHRPGAWLTGLLAIAFVLSGCGSPGGTECDSDADCPAAYECVSSGGVVFGESICLQTVGPLDAGPDLDAQADADAQASDAGADADQDADTCSALDADQICQRDAKNCGTYTADNGCGRQVEVQCGTCEAPEVCAGGGADDNVCGCPDVDPAEVCARHNKDCGTIDAEDACGNDVSVDCGTCDDQDCGGTTPNVCGCPCQINGVCIPAGGHNPARPCEVCDPAQSTQAWTQLPKDTACDDGDPCTVDTTCRPSGLCRGSAVDCSHLDDVCEQGVCDGGSCVTEILEGEVCDDGDFCTVDTTCLADGTCSGDPRSCETNPDQCLDNVCDSAAGVCQPEPTSGAACDDGLSCTTGSMCELSGDCAVGAIDSGSCLIDGVCVEDGDTNPANSCEVCDASVDQTGWSQLPDETICENGDGLSCTGTCSAGACVDTVHDGHCAIDGSCYVDSDPNPANACELCDVAADQSAWTSDTGASCDDGLSCTGSGTCDAAGTCEPGAATSGSCYIGGNCYQQGQDNPTNSCQYCEPAQDQYAWTSKSAQTACGSGGTFCTCNDTGQCEDFSGNACL